MTESNNWRERVCTCRHAFTEPTYLHKPSCPVLLIIQELSTAKEQARRETDSKWQDGICKMFCDKARTSERQLLVEMLEGMLKGYEPQPFEQSLESAHFQKTFTWNSALVEAISKLKHHEQDNKI